MFRKILKIEQKDSVRMLEVLPSIEVASILVRIFGKLDIFLAHVFCSLVHL